MIRDMLATNTGIKLRWPNDYTVTSDEFRARIFKDYRPRIPIYFATTVSTDNLEDVKGHLLEKCLVLLVVPQEMPPGQELDGPASLDILEHRLRLKSTLDPRVVKDENTQGLMGNYAKTFLDIAQYADRIADTSAVITTCDHAVRLGLDSERTAQVMFLSSKLLADVGATDKAQTFLDSANKLVKQDDRVRVQTSWVQAQILRSRGNYPAAETLYLANARIAPDLYWDLSDMYHFDLKDNARAESVLDTWYRMVPQNWGNTVRYVEGLRSTFADRQRALQVLDAWAAKNPRDSARVKAYRGAI
jgi:tetratricopeptide (TPR) repeat protein